MALCCNSNHLVDVCRACLFGCGCTLHALHCLTCLLVCLLVFFVLCLLCMLCLPCLWGMYLISREIYSGREIACCGDPCLPGITYKDVCPGSALICILRMIYTTAEILQRSIKVGMMKDCIFSHSQVEATASLLQKGTACGGKLAQFAFAQLHMNLQTIQEARSSGQLGPSAAYRNVSKLLQGER